MRGDRLARLFLVSLDLLVALPILGIVSLLLFSSIYTSQRSLQGLAEWQYWQLKAFGASQQAAVLLDSSQVNYTAAETAVSGIADNASVSFGLLPANEGACPAVSAVCRLVTLSGVPYLLVVYNASTG